MEEALKKAQEELTKAKVREKELAGQVVAAEEEFKRLAAVSADAVPLAPAVPAAAMYDRLVDAIVKCMGNDPLAKQLKEAIGTARSVIEEEDKQKAAAAAAGPAPSTSLPAVAAVPAVVGGGGGADEDGDTEMADVGAAAAASGHNDKWSFARVVDVYRGQKLEGSKIVSSGKVGPNTEFTAEQVQEDWAKHCGYKGTVEAVRELLRTKKSRKA